MNDDERTNDKSNKIWWKMDNDTTVHSYKGIGMSAELSEINKMVLLGSPCGRIALSRPVMNHGIVYFFNLAFPGFNLEFSVLICQYMSFKNLQL